MGYSSFVPPPPSGFMKPEAQASGFSEARVKPEALTKPGSEASSEASSEALVKPG